MSLDLNTIKTTNLTKPFLKWVGGKTQLIETLFQKFPKEINNYHEPFLGGGSVLLAMLSLQKYNHIKINGSLYAYDFNESLINVYNQIKMNKDELLSYINKYYDEYKSINGDVEIKNPTTEEQAKTSQGSYYYWIRKQYNSMEKTTAESAALFIIINKLCFRGMYREGPNGYNVPFGHYKTPPKMPSKTQLYELSSLFQNVEFKVCSFEEALTNTDSIVDGDFVYLDPPYAPESDKSFVGYTKDGFNLEKHKTLFTLINQLKSQNKKFVLSNSNVDMVTSAFQDCNKHVVNARRAINSKNPAAKTEEVIIYN